MEQDTNTIKAEPVTLGSKGYYSLNVYKSDGTEVVEKRVTDSQNVVTFEGAYQIFFEGRMFSLMYANVGTGVTELTRSSSGLGNRFSASSSYGGAARAGNEVDNGNGTSTLTLTRTMPFSLGATTGTFSEVGMSLEANGTNFIAGQLIKDEFGSPTTITILADEQLRVTYTLELTVPNGGQGAKNIGSGTVTTPEGTSNYTIYSQPFFSGYTVGSSGSDVVAYKSSMSYLRNAGEASSGVATEFNVGNPSVSRSDGTVTIVTGSATAAPSSFSKTSLKYQLFGQGNVNAAYTGINPVTKLRPDEGHSFAGTHTLLEYETPIVKNNTRSYRARLTLTYNI